MHHRVRPSCTLQPTVSTETASGPSTETLSRFLSWFRGDFDNYYRCAEVGRGGHEHMHCRLTPVSDEKLAASGAAVVIANYYYNGRPDVVFQQRVYRISVEQDRIEMRMYRMKSPHDLKAAEPNGNFQ